MLVQLSLSNGHEYITKTTPPIDTSSPLFLRCGDTCRVFNLIGQGQHHMELMPMVDPGAKGLDERPYRDEMRIEAGHIVMFLEVNEFGLLYRTYQHVMGQKIVVPISGKAAN